MDSTYEPCSGGKQRPLKKACEKSYNSTRDHGPFIRKGLAQILSWTGALCFPDSHSKVVSLYLAFFLVHSSLIFKIILMIFNRHCLTSYLLVPILNLPMVLSSVAQLCPAFCDLMYCSTPGFPVHYQLPELAQTHVHQVSDAIQSSHPLSFPFPPTFNLSQHQGLFQWVSSSHQVAKVLELQLQHQSFQMNIQDWFSLALTGLISLQSKGLSRVFCNTIVQKSQFWWLQPWN